MKHMYSTGLIISTFSLLLSCGKKQPDFDATGVFEADEILVSSEVPGRITTFSITEGDILDAGAVVAMLDAGNLQLQQQQVEASMAILPEKITDVGPQVEMLNNQLQVQQAQMSNLEQEKNRFSKLVEADAATPKQLDDLKSQITILQRQMAVTQSQIKVQQTAVATQNRGLMSEKRPLAKKLETLQDQTNRSKVINPITGTVLAKYAYEGEVTGAGKALYKIADLSTVYLRAFITADQLTQVKLGQQVWVYTDSTRDAYREHAGIISWISDKAEFTPKTIQTKNERANQVFAVKIKVPNDGYLKIGQYGEVKWQQL